MWFKNIPLLHGNWVDLIILLVLLWYFFAGWQKNFLAKTFELLGLLVSFVSALKFYQFFSYFLIGNFSLSKGISDAIGFLLAAAISELVFSTIFETILDRLPRSSLLNTLNKFFGFIPSLINGLILLAFFLTLLVSLPVNSAVKSDILSAKIGGVLVLRTQSLERKINQIFGGAVNETLSFLTVKPEGKDTVDLHFKTKEYTVDYAGEQAMLTLINQERKSRTIRPLAFDEKLAEVARVHAKDMLEKGYFSHDTPGGVSPFTRLNQTKINYDTAGENLAFAPNVNIAHNGLMDSPGHKANILNSDFGKIGIGVIDGGIYGKMFVQEFTN